MGVIDKAVYNLTCLDCGEVEGATILDKGSNYGGSWWCSRANFIKFDTAWEGGGVKEPKLTSKKCKKCGSTNIDVNRCYRP